MKKIYLLTTGIFLFILNFSYAQDGVNYGFKGGLNMGTAKIEASAMGMSIEFDTKYRTSFYAGAFIEYPLENLSPNLYGQIEAQYVSNGFKVEESDIFPEFSSRMDQLNIPISIKYRIIDQVALAGGFYGGFTLNVEEEYTDGEKYDATEEYESFDAGLLVGLEVNLTNRVFIEGRYNHGLVDLLSAEVEGGSGSYKNRFIQLGVGIKF